MTLPSKVGPVRRGGDEAGIFGIWTGWGGGSGVEILAADGGADGAAALGKKGDLFTVSGSEQRQKRSPSVEEFFGAFDLEADEFAVIVGDFGLRGVGPR